MLPGLPSPWAGTATVPLLASQSPAHEAALPPASLPGPAASEPLCLLLSPWDWLPVAFPLGSRKPFLQGCGQCWELGRAPDGEPWSCPCLCSAEPHVLPLSSLHLAFFIWRTGWPWPPALPLSQRHHGLRGQWAGQGTPQSHAPQSHGQSGSRESSPALPLPSLHLLIPLSLSLPCSLSAPLCPPNPRQGPNASEVDHKGSLGLVSSAGQIRLQA